MIHLCSCLSMSEKC